MMTSHGVTEILLPAAYTKSYYFVVDQVSFQSEAPRTQFIIQTDYLPKNYTLMDMERVLLGNKGTIETEMTKPGHMTIRWGNVFKAEIPSFAPG